MTTMNTNMITCVTNTGSPKTFNLQRKSFLPNDGLILNGNIYLIIKLFLKSFFAFKIISKEKVSFVAKLLGDYKEWDNI